MIGKREHERKREEVRGNRVSEKKRERRDCEERIMSKKSC